MGGKDVISIKDYIDTKVTDLEKRLNEHYKLTDRAVEIAARTLESRLQEVSDLKYKFAALKEQVDYNTGNTAGRRWAIGIIAAIALSAAALVVNLF